MKLTAIILMLFVALAADAAITAAGDASGGVRVFAGVDLLGLKNYRASDWARESPGLLKLIAYPLDYAGYMLGEHPIQSLIIIFAALEATETTNITGWFDDSDKPHKTHDNPSTVQADDASIYISANSGDGSPITIIIHSPTEAASE